MNSGPGRSHFCRQSAFAQVLFVHQVVHFQGHGPLERCGLNLFDHFLFSEEIPEVAAAMFVSRLNYMTVSFLIRLSKRDLQLESWKLGDRSREQGAESRERGSRGSDMSRRMTNDDGMTKLSGGRQGLKPIRGFGGEGGGGDGLRICISS